MSPTREALMIVLARVQQTERFANVDIMAFFAGAPERVIQDHIVRCVGMLSDADRRSVFDLIASYRPSRSGDADVA